MPSPSKIIPFRYRKFERETVFAQGDSMKTNLIGAVAAAVAEEGDFLVVPCFEINYIEAF